MGNFNVWYPCCGQQIEDGQVITASSPDEAATLWAQYWDNHTAEYAIASESSVPEVCVQAEGSETILRYVVSGFMSPTYLARLKTSRVNPEQ